MGIHTSMRGRKPEPRRYILGSVLGASLFFLFLVWALAIVPGLCDWAKSGGIWHWERLLAIYTFLSLIFIVFGLWLWLRFKRLVTALRQAQMDSAESHEFLGNIINTLEDVIYVKDEEHRWVLLNDRACQLVGRPRDELLGKSDAEIFAPDLAESIIASDLEVLRTGRTLVSEEHFRMGGQSLIFSTKKSLLEDQFTDRRFIVFSGHDITERKRLDARLQQEQKLASLQSVAGGVAHDFNNILSGILGYTEIALLDMDGDSPARESVEKIIQLGNRAAKLTEHMLAYSGRRHPHLELLDLSGLAKRTVDVLAPAAADKVRVTYSLTPGLPFFMADAGQLEQVASDLVINAIEAFDEGGGEIAVSTGVMDCGQDYLASTYVDDGLPAGRYVFLEVRDTGKGIAPEDIPRIFDPFFTTKFIGRGLGLAGLLGIVRAHQGAVKVDSRPSEGTSFRVLFPVPEETEETVSAKVEGGSPVLGGDGIILLVDDEVHILDMDRQILESRGYRVLTAAGGPEALEIFRQRAEDIALVLLDLTMPRMSGDEVFREMNLVRPGVPVLISSGFTEEQVMEKFTDAKLAGFLQKPYSLQVLLDRVEELVPKG